MTTVQLDIVSAYDKQFKGILSHISKNSSLNSLGKWNSLDTGGDAHISQQFFFSC